MADTIIKMAQLLNAAVMNVDIIFVVMVKITKSFVVNVSIFGVLGAKREFFAFLKILNCSLPIFLPASFDAGFVLLC